MVSLTLCTFREKRIIIERDTRVKIRRVTGSKRVLSIYVARIVDARGAGNTVTKVVYGMNYYVSRWAKSFRDACEARRKWIPSRMSI